MKNIIKLYLSIMFWIVLSNISKQFYLWSGTNVTEPFIKLYKILLLLFCPILVHYMLTHIKRKTDKNKYLFALLVIIALYFYKDILSQIRAETSLGALSITLLYGFIIIPFAFFSTKKIFKYFQKI